MPYNALGDLYKIEVVKRLQKMGCTIYSSQVFDADAWHPSIVDAVLEYLQNSGRA